MKRVTSLILVLSMLMSCGLHGTMSKAEKQKKEMMNDKATGNATINAYYATDNVLLANFK